MLGLKLIHVGKSGPREKWQSFKKKEEKIQVLFMFDY